MCNVGGPVRASVKEQITAISQGTRLGRDAAPEERIDTDYKCYNAWA